MESAVIRTMLGLLQDGPASLEKSLRFAAAFEDDPYDYSPRDLLAYLDQMGASANDSLDFRRRVSEWDARTDETGWTEGTAPQSRARRLKIYELLGLSDGDIAEFDRLFPMYESAGEDFVVSREFDRWYDEERAQHNGFYWPHYRTYLFSKGWDEDAVESLSLATARVTERLARPDDEIVRPSRGLVIGYVQSGKTANFTGVLARAADAGYRFIIVMTGTTTLLRNQTQRRIDKELIGKEMIRDWGQPGGEYELDGEKDEFASYGTLPSRQGWFDWDRLTTLTDDYQKLRAGITALEFARIDETKRWNDPVNLKRMNVRFLVVKKNPTVLRKLAHDLSLVDQRMLTQIPTLVIDDESDQASINTVRPRAIRSAERTAVNQEIVNILKQLPRAQYVGYTATPFANVFVDPNDNEDIFPADFILSLDRPAHYMGAANFHDFDGGRTNELAYVRDVTDHEDDFSRLEDAIDAYVLAGAIKLFRADRGFDVSVRHHTMLIHNATSKERHREAKHEAERLLSAADYGGRGHARLERMLDDDFRRTSASLGVDPAEMPGSLAELWPYIGSALSKIQHGGSSGVLMVNSERDADVPNFEAEPIWKIIVGGAKLSRGYTIEGLTVSYFRRVPSAEDSLMQMGRWFGFRRGYRDLMRLFLGRNERGNPVKGDIYRAFEAACRDEQLFRREVKKYALGADGDAPLRPYQVPPLVSQFLPHLPPTAKNKMYNAVLKGVNLSGEQVARTMAPESAALISKNQDAADKLLRVAKPVPGGFGKDRALIGSASAKIVRAFLGAYKWHEDVERPVIGDLLSYLDGEFGDPGIAEWQIVSPLTVTQPNGTLDIGGCVLDPIVRARVGIRFGVYTDPAHVRAAKMMASTGRAVLLLYAVGEHSTWPRKKLTIGWAAFLPPNKSRGKLKWGVRSGDPSDPSVPAVIDAS